MPGEYADRCHSFVRSEIHILPTTPAGSFFLLSASGHILACQEQSVGFGAGWLLCGVP
jgi:hypothetical protein